VVKYIARGGRQVSDLAHRRRRDGDLGGAGVHRRTPAPLEPTLERSRGQVGTSPHVGRPSNNRGHLRAGERAGSVPVRGTREGTRPALERQRCRYAGRSGERTTGLEPATFGMVSSSARPPAGATSAPGSTYLPRSGATFADGDVAVAGCPGGRAHRHVADAVRLGLPHRCALARARAARPTGHRPRSPKPS